MCYIALNEKKNVYQTMYSIGWSLIKIWAGLEDSERIPRILKEFLEGSESIMRGFSFIQEMCDYMSKILQDI
mgnify:CR=1 FL=1